MEDKQQEYQSKALKNINDHIRTLGSRKNKLQWEIKVLEKLKQSTHIIGNKVIFEKEDVLYFDHDLCVERSNLIVVECELGLKEADIVNRSISKYDIAAIEEFISELQETLGYMKEALTLRDEGNG